MATYPSCSAHRRAPDRAGRRPGRGCPPEELLGAREGRGSLQSPLVRVAGDLIQPPAVRMAAGACACARPRSRSLERTFWESRVTTLEQRVTTVETQAVLAADRDLELLYLRSKVIDLEDRSRRANVRILGFLEEREGADVQSFLKNTLP
ncbi:hypothetical protein NDU88_003159 [Pleurodeles waltl]|uniref:Uncharacterized protein n=1 Tax=Pleurodeles waltl TaxID=8319 RepID=A0AAV7LHQ9_PLEWA|nr:hypothetical protein NDU88_003159 [Pleurodeles waltl]